MSPKPITLLVNILCMISHMQLTFNALHGDLLSMWTGVVVDGLTVELVGTLCTLHIGATAIFGLWLSHISGAMFARLI